MLGSDVCEIINLCCLKNIFVPMGGLHLLINGAAFRVHWVCTVAMGRKSPLFLFSLKDKCASYFLIPVQQAQAGEMATILFTHSDLKPLVASKYRPSPLGLVIISFCQNENVCHVEAR